MSINWPCDLPGVIDVDISEDKNVPELAIVISKNKNVPELADVLNNSQLAVALPHRYRRSRMRLSQNRLSGHCSFVASSTTAT